MDLSVIDTGTMSGRIVGCLSWAKSVSEAPRVESCVLVSRSSERHTPPETTKVRPMLPDSQSPVQIDQPSSLLASHSIVGLFLGRPGKTSMLPPSETMLTSRGGE